ncbi:hypothetical protein H2201_006878 [Coniosporium apollinis]|uniref:Epoxide hydrolase N-terminal domain-containing protein n=1 Tax=Coniosporium apollinis TaxID=61459 RepID=A0ABQ9NKP2_9PEZI|nr:hypothetical protein H2201_006878 [Coniosporium apollinis]
MHVKLTRLPRELQLPQHRKWQYGTPKAALEPLVDFWLEHYDWRAQESHYNSSLPQWRTTVTPGGPDGDEGAHTPLRVHFVHKASQHPNAIPLLFVHGWPGSFLEVSKVIDALTEPTTASAANPFRDAENHGETRVRAFHVVAPSIPGFGFSDASMDEGFGLKETAEIFDVLMKRLGYNKYVAHGADGGFKVCRMLALRHPESCLAVHTSSSKLPMPALRRRPLEWLKYHTARLTGARAPWLRFGYTPTDMLPVRHSSYEREYLVTDTSSSMPSVRYAQRPQTTAYALCDSPVGLLASMLDVLYTSSDAYTWTPREIINWTMMQWLPGPEAGLRWLRQVQTDTSSLWDDYSAVPLGISQFRTSGETSSPPVWAAAFQNLKWVKRHERFARCPAWDAPEQLVLDIRDFVREMIDGRYVNFEIHASEVQPLEPTDAQAGRPQ